MGPFSLWFLRGAVGFLGTLVYAYSLFLILRDARVKDLLVNQQLVVEVLELVPKVTVRRLGLGVVNSFPDVLRQILVSLALRIFMSIFSYL